MGLFNIFSKKDAVAEEKQLAKTEETRQTTEQDMVTAEPQKEDYISAFDWEVSKQFLESKEMIDEIAHAFAEEIDDYVGKLDRFSTQADEEAVKQYRITAHSVKSTCKMLGNMKLAKVAEGCEFAARDNDIAGISRMNPVLTEGLKSVQDFLRNL